MVRRVRLVADSAGTGRVAHGAGSDDKLCVRGGGNEEWRPISDESVTYRIEWPIWFSAGDKIRRGPGSEHGALDLPPPGR